jgi:C4-dicarboxylate transporter/malic acid transport protein
MTTLAAPEMPSRLASTRETSPFANIGPNWFAAVMGTGIVANAAATLPVASHQLRTPATIVWALAATILVVLSAAWIVHWTRFRATALGHALNPVMAQFWGAPPMALMTVGSGTLLLGRDWIGLDAAVRVDACLWVAGSMLGLITAGWIPYLMMTRHEIKPGDAFGGWLMPVVPPMVSAATGALLVPHMPAGQLQLSMVYACYAMFGISLLATLILLPQIWASLVTRPSKDAPNKMAPTVWIILGPLGQSVTAAGSLGAVAPRPYAAIGPAIGVFYGVPTLGFGLLWLVVAAALTRHAARAGLKFALNWWSFTFPVGTMVTGASSLAAHTGASLFRVVAVALYVLLVSAWLLVASRTVRGVVSGALLKP